MLQKSLRCGSVAWAQALVVKHLMVVQVWSTQQQNRVAEIEVRANVCAVQWNPISSFELAVGSANHDVHLYDLRQPSEPTHVFKGEAPCTALPVHQASCRFVLSADPQSFCQTSRRIEGALLVLEIRSVVLLLCLSEQIMADQVVLHSVVVQGCHRMQQLLVTQDIGMNEFLLITRKQMHVLVVLSRAKVCLQHSAAYQAQQPMTCQPTIHQLQLPCLLGKAQL